MAEEQEQEERKRNLDETIRAAKERTLEKQERALKKRKLKRKVANNLVENGGKAI